MRALIVDDSPVMRMLIACILRQAILGFDEVLHAGNGADGLAALERAAASGRLFDLILSDMHMPVMDGLEFLRERQRRNLAGGVPVVMISADSDDRQIAEALAAGASVFLSKPFTLEQMQTSVALLLPAAA